MSVDDDGLIDVRVVIDAAALERLAPMDAIAPLWWGVQPSIDVAAWKAGLAPYTRPQQLVYAMVWHGAEAGNGGHDQFFWNTTGIVWRDALEGYREARIGDVAALLAAAVARMGGDPPLEKVARCQLMNFKKPNFDDMDDAFFPILNGDLNDRIMHYVRNHAADFAFDGVVRLMPELTAFSG
ncbi:MAG: DUF4375 domain-containing protein [Hyphomonadaceae bacterium]